MPTGIKKKVIVKSAVPKDKVAGCKLIPLHRKRAKFPTAQDNILAGTYYRVEESKPDTLVSMVTIMPDGLYVAWASCAKCRQHVRYCECRTGFYHPASVGWIRATYEHDDWPAHRIMDYKEFYDPFMRREKSASDDAEPFTYRPPVTKPAPKPKKTKTMTAEEIEAIDMAELQKVAVKEATKTTRKVRSISRKKK
jgi:hypothetical protein